MPPAQDGWGHWPMGERDPAVIWIGPVSVVASGSSRASPTDLALEALKMTIRLRQVPMARAPRVTGRSAPWSASPACSATWVGDRSRVFGAALAQTGVHHQPTRPCATD